MTRSFQVTFDCADPAGEAVFWADALGYVIQPPPNGFDSW
ncbi:MAG: VOC family protein, partial [Nocardioidaceae bacterium]|nr:VOC family protein [Nocardioidaceae bacterium]